VTQIEENQHKVKSVDKV